MPSKLIRYGGDIVMLEKILAGLGLLVLFIAGTVLREDAYRCWRKEK